MLKINKLKTDKERSFSCFQPVCSRLNLSCLYVSVYLEIFSSFHQFSIENSSCLQQPFFCFVAWICSSMWCFYFSFKERFQVPEHVLPSPFPTVLILKSLIVIKLVSLISLSLASRNLDLAASILTFLSTDSSRIFAINRLMLVLMVQLKTYN